MPETLIADVDARLDRRGRVAAQVLGAVIGQAGGARLGQRRERIGDGRRAGDRRRAEAGVAALLDAAVHVDDGGLHRGVAAGRQGARRAGVDVDAAARC